MCTQCERCSCAWAGARLRRSRRPYEERASGEEARRRSMRFFLQVLTLAEAEEEGEAEAELAEAELTATSVSVAFGG